MYLCANMLDLSVNVLQPEFWGMLMEEREREIHQLAVLPKCFGVRLSGSWVPNMGVKGQMYCIHMVST